MIFKWILNKFQMKIKWIIKELFIFLPMVMGTEDAAGGEEATFQMSPLKAI